MWPHPEEPTAQHEEKTAFFRVVGIAPAATPQPGFNVIDHAAATVDIPLRHDGRQQQQVECERHGRRDDPTGKDVNGDGQVGQEKAETNSIETRAAPTLIAAVIVNPGHEPYVPRSKRPLAENCKCPAIKTSNLGFLTVGPPFFCVVIWGTFWSKRLPAPLWDRSSNDLIDALALTFLD